MTTNTVPSARTTPLRYLLNVPFGVSDAAFEGAMAVLGAPVEVLFDSFIPVTRGEQMLALCAGRPELADAAAFLERALAYSGLQAYRETQQLLIDTQAPEHPLHTALPRLLELRRTCLQYTGEYAALERSLRDQDVDPCRIFGTEPLVSVGEVAMTLPLRRQLAELAHVLEAPQIVAVPGRLVTTPWREIEFEDALSGDSTFVPVLDGFTLTHGVVLGIIRQSGSAAEVLDALSVLRDVLGVQPG